MDQPVRHKLDAYAAGLSGDTIPGIRSCHLLFALDTILMCSQTGRRGWRWTWTIREPQRVAWEALV